MFSIYESEDLQWNLPDEHHKKAEYILTNLLDQHS